MKVSQQNPINISLVGVKDPDFLLELKNDEESIRNINSFKLLNKEVCDDTVKLWDIPTIAMAKSITASRNEGLVMIYDVSNQDSFDNITNYINDMDARKALGNMVKFIVGVNNNPDNREVHYKSGQDLADKFGAHFMEYRGKTKEDAQELFDEVISQIRAKVHGEVRDGNKVTPMKKKKPRETSTVSQAKASGLGGDSCCVVM